MRMFHSETLWTGNTWAIRSEIKALGGQWDAQRKMWVVPPLNMRQREVAARLCRVGGVNVNKRIS